MLEREFSQYLLSSQGEVDEHAPLISLIAAALNETALYKAIYQLNRAVMLKLESLGQFPYRRLPSLRQTLQGQQQLVLLRLYASRTGRLLAKVQEAANLVAEFGQRLVFLKRNVSIHNFYYIVLRHKFQW